MTMDNARVPAGAPVTADQIEAYRDEASFLWTQRRDALDAPHYSPQQFADHIGKALDVSGLAVFIEEERGAPFTVRSWLPLSGA